MVIRIERIDNTPSRDKYDFTFFNKRITTIVTTRSRIVTKWISDIENNQRAYLDHLIVGFDIKYSLLSVNPSTPVATLQLCIGTKCLIYQLMHIGATDDIPDSLRLFLSNPAYTFVGNNISYKMSKLHEQYRGLGVNAFVVELGVLAAVELYRPDLWYVPLHRLARVMLPTSHRYYTPHEVLMSHWENRRLTDTQLKWACVDAYVSFHIGIRLNASDWRWIIRGDRICL